MIILIFFIALVSLFAGLGIQKHKLATRVKNDAERTQHYAHQLLAIESGKLWRIDSLESMRDLVCLGRAFRAYRANGAQTVGGEMRSDGSDFRLDTPHYAQQIDLLKQGVEAKNWGARYQSIDTIANLRLHTLFGFLLQHSLSEKNTNVTSHCLHVCALLLRSAEEFDALANRLNHDNQLSTNLIEGLTRIAIQQLQEHQNARAVQRCLTACLTSTNYDQLFKIGLINAIGKEQIVALKEVLIALANDSEIERDTNLDSKLDSSTDTYSVTRPDSAITLAVMRAIASFGRYDALIRR